MSFWNARPLLLGRSCILKFERSEAVIWRPQSWLQLLRNTIFAPYLSSLLLNTKLNMLASSKLDAAHDWVLTNKRWVDIGSDPSYKKLSLMIPSARWTLVNSGVKHWRQQSLTAWGSEQLGKTIHHHDHHCHTHHTQC